MDLFRICAFSNGALDELEIARFVPRLLQKDSLCLRAVASCSAVISTPVTRPFSPTSAALTWQSRPQPLQTGLQTKRTSNTAVSVDAGGRGAPQISAAPRRGVRLRGRGGGGTVQ
jgi:hypothetical protein